MFEHAGFKGVFHLPKQNAYRTKFLPIFQRCVAQFTFLHSTME